MTAPNRATLWGEVLVDELAAAGVEAVCSAPGSRSTPIAVAVAEHPDLRVFSHLDERSAAFFALGRGRRTGQPTAVVSTSGTAAANFHPAVIEADEGRIPLLVLTADRPPELGDSGANQTVDQERLYGNAVRWYRTLPEPAPEPRKLRSLRVSADRAVSETTGQDPGPVHLNVPVAKPLEPTPVAGDVPTDLAEQAPLAVEGRPGPFVRTETDRSTLGPAQLDDVADAIREAGSGLVVCGPATGTQPAPEPLRELVAATGFPVLADPLSGHRFGGHVTDLPVCGGYDSYLAAAENWDDPEVVLRFGASPTSKRLRQYLRDAQARQFLVDPAGGWREAEFTASDRLTVDPSWLAAELGARLGNDGPTALAERFAKAESRYWSALEEAFEDPYFEGALLSDVAALLPDPATLFVSNSMPVRDLDRFGRPRAADLSVLGNRGASGIDGIVSTALGAGSATDDPLVCVLGDLAYYHDMNGLLAIVRCDVDATIVLVDNDGGGIFHKLPIEDFDPPFTDLFRTPHGLDFAPTADLYDLEFVPVEDRDGFQDAFEASVGREGTDVLAVEFDAEASHRRREAVDERVRDHFV
jgi:2-succinyl-5-enolpyruvyl-6-hydroxy-3-cyclohexene-1-carboxylate synthase